MLITNKDKIGDTKLVFSRIKGSKVEYILAYGPDFKKVWIKYKKGYAQKYNFNDVVGEK